MAPFSTTPEIPGLDRQRLAELIRIADPAAAGNLRRALIYQIWKRDRLPIDSLPDRHTRGVAPAAFDGLTNLTRIDRLTVDLPYGLHSDIHLFIPETTNGTTVIYHSGHQDEGIVAGRAHIAALIEGGYTVLALTMPFKGSNLPHPPFVDTPDFGPIFFTAGHYVFGLLEQPDFDPLYIFLHPAIVAVNYARDVLGSRHVAMVGLSGGGWTTVVTAALDPRVVRSVDVAGSMPFFLRAVEPQAAWGDWEQTGASIYRLANYLELYVLASTGSERRHMQIHNRYDNCCFAGIGGLLYEPVVRDRVVNIAGADQFLLVIDDTIATHDISQHSIELILTELAGIEG